MKYMGSKRSMLLNGLGTLIQESVVGRKRFLDLFCGSAAVAKFVAKSFPIEVVATDLQQYAAVLGGAVLHRSEALDASHEWDAWLPRAKEMLAAEQDLLELATVLNVPYDKNARPEHFVSVVHATRHASSLVSDRFPLCKAYGGHYFGLLQSLWLDALRATVPNGAARETAIAALIEAASECSASPGHTAQPFAPTETGLPHLIGAWFRPVPQRVQARFNEICDQHARIIGTALVADAVEHTQELKEGDLVFIDPPYSEVQYSRFYHVLEGIAIGTVNEVFGVGRYTSIEDRPQSHFSQKLPAVEALNNLMIGVATGGAEAIVTFPQGNASNGLSGRIVEEISAQYFRVAKRSIKSTFSTLGGNGATREARQGATELILYLKPT
jgi:adenine-specific DNA-methyltransferase